MNITTKRVPRDACDEQMRTIRETVEAFGYEWTNRLEQMLRSVYAGAVSSAPADPLEDYFESVVETTMGRRVV